MEIGSFIGLDLRTSGEFYSGGRHIARLNSARAGIAFACKQYGCKAIYIPYYLCPSVRKFLQANGIEVVQYYINDRFEPVEMKQKEDHAILLVNYFGIIKQEKMESMASGYSNVIIDNSAAFFSRPLNRCYNVYSPRKFFGVPDGCYVIGDDAEAGSLEYEQDFSSSTSSFLLKRIEYGTNASYSERMLNEQRIDNSGILRMSELTKALLNSIDYHYVSTKRRENFFIAHDLLHRINKTDPGEFLDEECVPMVYPLVIEDAGLDEKLRNNKIYTGRWWNQVMREVNESRFEYWLSRYMLPLPIDQRYDKNVLEVIRDIIVS
jgi:hypothetical protein